MDTQETAADEQRRSVSTEDLVDWAHRSQPDERGDADRPQSSAGDRPAAPPVDRDTESVAHPEQTAEDRTADNTEQPTPLFEGGQVDELRSRWLQLQTAFVDEPRRAVQQADELVAEVMQTMAATFAAHKRELEGQWRREGTAETEELRLALRRYRSFFDQMLHA